MDVNGDNAIPLYKYLKEQNNKDGKSVNVEWNFTKFLIDTNGKVVKRYPSTVEPNRIAEDIRKFI